MWGHALSCNCTLCPSLRRVFRVVTEGTRIEPDLFVGYATIKVRNLVGELEDFLDAHRPQVREEPALPPPVTGDSSVERPPAEHRGPGSEKEVKQKEVRHQEASKEKGSKARQEEKAPRHAEASKKHPSRPAFHGDQEIEAGEGLSQEEREKATKSLAAKKLPSPPVRTRERSPKPEVRVKKEEEAADYSGDEWPVEEPGVREVYSQSPSREDKKRDFEGSPSPKKRKHRHHHDRSRDRKAKKHERSSSSTPVAGPSRPEEEVREVRRDQPLVGGRQPLEEGEKRTKESEKVTEFVVVHLLQTKESEVSRKVALWTPSLFLVGVLNPGLRLLEEGRYWGRDINLAFEVESVQIQGGALEVIALVHVKKLQRRSASDPGWVDNLKGSSGMEDLAERSDAAARAGGGGPGPAAEAIPTPGGGEEEKVSSESSESRKKKKRKKKKKKSFKVGGKQEYGALFAGTGLDKDSRTRKKVSRLARRALKKKSRGSSSTDSDGCSGELMEDELEELFQESARTQLAAKRGPGALAFHAMKQMRKQMLQTMGQEEEENTPLQPVGLQFFRQVLSPKMSPVMSREALNASAWVDEEISEELKRNKRGEVRVPSVEEREVLMGFPRGYTANCLPKSHRSGKTWVDERLSLIGNSWCVFVIAWLISCLGVPRGLCNALSLDELMQQCKPGGGKMLQGFLLRPFMRVPRGRVEAAQDTLIRKLSGLISGKGEDLLLQAPSEDVEEAELWLGTMEEEAVAGWCLWRLMAVMGIVGWGHEHGKVDHCIVAGVCLVESASASSGSAAAAIPRSAPIVMALVQAHRMMYSPIIDGYAERGDGDEAATWLSQAEEEGNLDDAKKWLERAEAQVPAGFACEMLFGLLPLLGLDGIGSKVSYNSLIKAAAVSGEMNRMKEHLAEMQSLKLRPSMLTYGTLVSAYADAGDIQNAQRWYDEALAGRGKSNTILLAVLLKAYIKANLCNVKTQTQTKASNHSSHPQTMQR
ncbi:Pentatricopeptide repeat-containing protein At3g06920 [Durusdinium trenchii]|uniref:Pentatricopeptide repeat-containing protein At3g06920 n=1 Tax=Durusdinium trenchii TaxID=1381693 RepID=A0ABP0L467_9DINO